ncbi:MAG: hypothetical protein ACYCW6_28100 [Candidatus Xenobia bacterium]
MIVNTHGLPPMARELWLSLAEATVILRLSHAQAEALLLPLSRWRDGQRQVSERTVRELYAGLTV